MPSTPEEQRPALVQFRLDLISALTSLKLEINALEAALIDKRLIDKGDLMKARKSEKQNEHLVRDDYCEKIGPAWEIR